MSVDWKLVDVRYTNAKNSFNNMQKLMEEAMRLSMPQRNFFYDKTRDGGDDKEQYIFDNTAKLASFNFVNTLRQALLPKNFFRFVPGDNVPKSQKNALAGELARLTVEANNLLYRSALNNAASEALSDAAVSSGFIQIDENIKCSTTYKKVNFSCAPLCKVYFQEDAGLITSTWREVQDILYNIKKQFYFVNFDAEGMDDGSEATVIEGCVYMPRYEEDKEPFIYYLKWDDEEEEEVLYQERRSYPLRFGFGFDRYAFGNFRMGPIMKLLPSIRMANSIAELNFLGLQYNSLPIMGIRPEMFENPQMTRLVPGATIKLNSLSTPANAQVQPAFQIPIQINSQASQLQLQSIQNVINTQLLNYPIPDPQDKVRTATEVNQIKQQVSQWISAFGGRLKMEMLDQLVIYATRAFRRSGFLVRDNPKKAFEVDFDNIAIEYNNAITDADSIDQIQALDNYRSIMQSWFGPQMALAAVDVSQIPKMVGDDLALPPTLYKSPEAVQALLKQMQSGVAQQQQQQAQNDPAANPDQAPAGATVTPPIAKPTKINPLSLISSG